MVTNRGFFTKLCGDIDFEGMVIDICYDDQLIASVNYDKGVDKIEIEVIKQKEAISSRFFPLDQFIKILEEAKSLAIRCANEDKLRGQE